jgi:hypothetical protein|tara:strand:- start:171 stop:626 length:456 start_codon:yes stop_codon:yes gene_type:complete
MKLEITPISINNAKIFIDDVHRHHKSPRGGLFAISVAQSNDIVGVCIAGRPVSRHLDNGYTVEITRLAVLDGYKNACSMLYSAAWRAARAMGYKKAITYILKEELGTSVKAAGWKCIGEAGGGSWDRKNRPRIDKHPTQIKLKFEITEKEK